MLGSTVEALAEVGYERLSFDDVAARAGVHKTTLYRRWPSKPELVLDALHARSDLIVEMPDTGRVADDLVTFLRTVAANVTTPIGRALVLATLQTGHEADDASSLRHRFWDERFERVRTRLDHARQAGQLPADIDGVLLVEALVSPIFFRTFIRGEPVDARYLRSLVHTVLDTQGDSPSPPRPAQPGR